jgi:hypothetical protein
MRFYFVLFASFVFQSFRTRVRQIDDEPCRP